MILTFGSKEYGRYNEVVVRQGSAVVKRGSTPVSTVLRRSVRFFIINIFLIKIIIELSTSKSGKRSGQMFSFSNFGALDRNPEKETLGKLQSLRAIR